MFKKVIAGLSAGFLVISISPAAAAQEDSGAKQVDEVQQAYRLRMDGDVDAAREALDEVLEARPGNAVAWFELARLEFYRAGKTQDMDAAQEAIETAIELDQANARYLTFAGRIAVYNTILKAHAGKTDEMAPQMVKAVAALEKALTLDPDCHEARLLLVSCYGNNPAELGGDRKKAEQHVVALEELSPVHGAEARCDFSDDSPAAKVTLWTDLAERLESEPRVHENLARQRARAGEVDKAIESVDRAIALDPQRSQVLLDVALILALDGQLEPAEKLVSRFLAQKPGPARGLQAYASMMLGRIRTMAGDQEAGNDLLARARELDSYCWFTMRPPPEVLFEAL